MKTSETRRLEMEIWKVTNKQGVFGCFEVTIGWFGKERQGPVFAEMEHTITGIVCVHYVKSGQVRFLYELDNSGKLVQLEREFYKQI